MAKEEIIVLIDLKISEAAHDIVKESGQSLSALVEDALKRHPDVAERMIYLEEKNSITVSGSVRRKPIDPDSVTIKYEE